MKSGQPANQPAQLGQNLDRCAGPRSVRDSITSKEKCPPLQWLPGTGLRCGSAVFCIFPCLLFSPSSTLVAGRSGALLCYTLPILLSSILVRMHPSLDSNCVCIPTIATSPSCSITMHGQGWWLIVASPTQLVA